MARNSVNKGGRPKVEQKRTNRYYLYFSDTEKELLDDFLKDNNLNKKEKGVLFREIIMDSITNKKIVFNKVIAPEFILKLNKLGINLNQLLKRLNTVKSLSSNDEHKIKSILSDIYETYIKNK